MVDLLYDYVKLRFKDPGHYIYFFFAQGLFFSPQSLILVLSHYLMTHTVTSLHLCALAWVSAQYEFVTHRETEYS